MFKFILCLFAIGMVNSLPAVVQTTPKAEAYTIKTVIREPDGIYCMPASDDVQPLWMQGGLVLDAAFLQAYTGDQKMSSVLKWKKGEKAQQVYYYNYYFQGFRIGKWKEGQLQGDFRETAQTWPNYISETAEYVIAKIEKIRWVRDQKVVTHPLITLVDGSTWLLAEVSADTKLPYKVGQLALIFKNIGTPEAYSFVMLILEKRQVLREGLFCTYEGVGEITFIDLSLIPDGEYTIEELE
ncbi:MAG: hypothetical protein H0X51_00920 [Parachlamydiaceae bacterium]|nr:hypothetical protein [Parachlamydiaceae bacterium]